MIQIEILNFILYSFQNDIFNNFNLNKENLNKHIIINIIGEKSFIIISSLFSRVEKYKERYGNIQYIKINNIECNELVSLYYGKNCCNKTIKNIENEYIIKTMLE